MSKVAKRSLLYTVLVVFLLLQGWAAVVQHGGGIAAKYSFVQGFTEYFRMSLADPLLTAGLIDFMAVAAILVVWLFAELPVDRRFKPVTWVWLISYPYLSGTGINAVFTMALSRSPDHARPGMSEAKSA